MGGNGFLVQSGFLLAEWGNTSRRFDISSAAKPVYTHLLLAAVESGKIAGLDEPVAEFEPRLLSLNAGLGYKDRNIIWRHLAGQASCYGVAEPPGTAFDYSDFQSALFWDTLLNRVYGVSHGPAADEVLHRLLTEPIRCQDSPRSSRREGAEGRLLFSTRDLVRLGYLYLRRGQWAGEQLLGEDLVALATASPHPPGLPRSAGIPAEMIPDQRSVGSGRNQDDHLGSYSMSWWINGVDSQGVRFWPDAPEDTFAMLGHGGREALIVIPSLDLVICWLQGLEEQGPETITQDGRLIINETLRRLMAAAGGPDASPQRPAAAPPPVPKPAGAEGARLSFTPPQRLETEGSQPHCTTDGQGALHVLFRKGPHIAYLLLDTGGKILLQETVPGSDGGGTPWIAVTREGTVHAVWDTFEHAYYARRTAAGWQPPLLLPQTYRQRNTYAQVTGGPGGDVYVSSWSLTKNVGGEALLYRIRDRAGETAQVDIAAGYGGGELRPSSILGPSAGTKGDGRVHALLGSPLTQHAILGGDGELSWRESLIGRRPGKSAEGIQGFFLGRDVGLVSSWRETVDTQSFLVNSRSRARQGKAAVVAGYGNGYPRAAFDPLSGLVYILYAAGDRARVSLWDPRTDRAEELGAVPGVKLTFRNWRWLGGRGSGAGGIAPRAGGGVHLVYSSGGELFHTTVVPPRP